MDRIWFGHTLWIACELDLRALRPPMVPFADPRPLALVHDRPSIVIGDGNPHRQNTERDVAMPSIPRCSYLLQLGKRYDGHLFPPKRFGAGSHTITPPPPASTSAQRALAMSLLLSFALWNLPYGEYGVYPFKVFATWLHEFCHGLVMMLTGAGFDYLELFPDTSGIAQAKRSAGVISRAIIASSGYMGASTCGALLLVLAVRPRWAKNVLIFLGVVLAATAFIWIRSTNDFGFTSTLLFSVACLVLGAFAGPTIQLNAATFLGVQSTLHCLLDIRVLFRPTLLINGVVVGQSDAHNMAQFSFGTPTFWSATWLVFSLLCFLIAFWARNHLTRANSL